MIKIGKFKSVEKGLSYRICDYCQFLPSKIRVYKYAICLKKYCMVIDKSD